MYTKGTFKLNYLANCLEVSITGMGCNVSNKLLPLIADLIYGIDFL
jgi:hypothetical protein